MPKAIATTGGMIVALVLASMSMTACSVGAQTRGDLSAHTTRGENAEHGLYASSIQHDGRKRTFDLYIPKGYPGDTPHGLVVALHGALGTGAIFEDQTRMRPYADRYGYLVVYPDGIGRAWNVGSNCCGKPHRKGIDDVSFISKLVAHLQKQYRIDDDRIFATGFSNGAMLTQHLACEKPDMFAAFAAVAGNIMGDDCHPDSATPMLMIAGRDDERIPWDGGDFRGTHRMSMARMSSRIGKRNSCSADTRVSLQHGNATCHTLTHCADNPVTYCGIKGMGHQWPEGKTYMEFLLGPNTKDYDATARILRFFRHIGSGE